MQFQLQALKEIQKNSQNGDILLLPALRVDRLESGIPGGKTHFLPKSDHTLLKIAPDVEMYLKNLNQKGLSITKCFYPGVDTYESDVKSLMKQILKTNSTFIDVGANIGYYSVIAF
ncbi:MAG: hypothetical protein PT120_11665 [Aphanizomenon gracile PMC649.10]|nr:hypothetical protein [Aphanizomenon gracile PMC649.10]